MLIVHEFETTINGYSNLSLCTVPIELKLAYKNAAGFSVCIFIALVSA